MNVQFTTEKAKSIPTTTGSIDKKEAIFQSTLSLIHEHGFHGTPMSRIALEAGVAIGSIYHYFSSKEELILELYLNTKENTYQAMLMGDHADLDYRSRFYNIWTNLVQYYMEFPAVLGFMHQFHSSPYAKMALTNDSFCLQDEVSNFLEEGIRNHQIKNLDIQIISAAFIGTVIATVRKHHMGEFIFDRSHMEEMAGIIWDGIRTERIKSVDGRTERQQD